MRIYTSCIRSKLDYGSIIYGSGTKSYLQVLDPIYNQVLRLCLVAYRTSPCQSLYAETNELSLNLRMKELSVNDTLKLKSNSNNPTYISIFNQQFSSKCTSKHKAIPPFGLCIQQLFSSASIDLEQLEHLPSQSLHPGNTTYHLSYLTSISIMINHPPLLNSL